MIARRALVSGRVQGVGFRYFARRAAEGAGVTGWARNLPDGRVETLAEGEASAVEQYLAKIRRGPIGGRVDQVEIEETTPEGSTAFCITG
ncbi:MAG: acylphosphatase [Acidobacteriota bacterium]